VRRFAPALARASGLGDVAAKCGDRGAHSCGIAGVAVSFASGDTAWSMRLSSGDSAWFLSRSAIENERRTAGQRAEQQRHADSTQRVLDAS